MPEFQPGKLYSLWDILGGGFMSCDLCRHEESVKGITPTGIRDDLQQSGWRFVRGIDICPSCVNELNLEYNLERC